LLIENIIADANYSSGENYKYLEKQDITGFIPVHGGFKNLREGFVYDEQKNTFTCPNNKELLYKRTFNGSAGGFKKEYRASAKDCGVCSLRSSCLTGKSKEKKIEITIHHKAYRKAYERQRSWLGRKMKRVRSVTVEPVFGQLIQYGGLRKINTRGKSQANKCMIMAAIAHNLKKLLKFMVKKVAVHVQQIPAKVLLRINQCRCFSTYCKANCQMHLHLIRQIKNYS
jgi:hypothetical protein